MLRNYEMAIAAVAGLDGVVSAEQDAWPELLTLRTAAQLAGAPDALTMLCRWRWAPEVAGDVVGTRAAITAEWLMGWSARLVRGFAFPLTALDELAGALGAPVPEVEPARSIRGLAAVTGRAAAARVPFGDALEVGRLVSAAEPYGAATDLVAGAFAAVFPVAALYRTGMPLLPMPLADDADARDAALASLLREGRALAESVRSGRRRWSSDHAAVRERHGRAGLGMQAVLRVVRTMGAITIPSAAAHLALTIPAVSAAVERLAADGLLAEVTGRGRKRAWCYAPWVTALG